MSWRTSAKLAIASLAIATVTPALAQQTGTRLDRYSNAPGSVSDRSTKSAIYVANQFGQCLARREGKLMRAALDLPLLSPEQNKAIARRMEQFEGCLGISSEFDKLQSSRLLISGGAAEYFVKTELKRTNLSSLDGMSDDVLEKTDYRPRTSLEDLGLCIVRRNVVKAKNLLAARATSVEETAMAKEIVPEIGPCVIAGTELKMNIPNIRALIAIAMYRAASKLEAGGA